MYGFFYLIKNRTLFINDLTPFSQFCFVVLVSLSLWPSLLLVMEFHSLNDFFRGPTEAEKKQLYDAELTEGQMIDGLFSSDPQKPCHFLDKASYVKEGEVQERFDERICDGQMLDILLEKNPEFENFGHMDKFQGPTKETLSTKSFNDGKIIDDLYEYYEKNIEEVTVSVDEETDPSDDTDKV